MSYPDFIRWLAFFKIEADRHKPEPDLDERARNWKPAGGE